MGIVHEDPGDLAVPDILDRNPHEFRFPPFAELGFHDETFPLEGVADLVGGDEFRPAVDRLAHGRGHFWMVVGDLDDRLEGRLLKQTERVFSAKGLYQAGIELVAAL